MAEQFWLGVAGSPRLLEEGLVETWWCLPAKAKKGDRVLFYATKKAGPKHWGVFSEAEVTVGPDEDNPENSQCKAFGHGELRRVEVRIVDRFARPITLNAMRGDSVISKAAFMRRSLQGTAFAVSIKEYERLVQIARSYRRAEQSEDATTHDA